MKEKFKTTIYGAIIGDALGVPVEFTSRKSRKQNPVVDMIGFGAYPFPAGTWSDDTSMSLCLIDSIGDKKVIDYKDIMQRFSDWANYARYTSDNKVFDIGGSCRKSIQNFCNNVPVLQCGQRSERDNGNGSLMRIAALPFYLSFKYGSEVTDNEEAFNVIHNVSSLTHAHNISLIGCDIYCTLMLEVIAGNREKVEIQKNAYNIIKKYVNTHSEFKYAFEKYCRIGSADFINLSEDMIKSSGYIVDSLEASLWCFLNTNNYKDCVLKAVNLGEDTDTIACIAGSIAAAYYNEIPSEWKNKIRNKSLIDSILKKWDI